MSQSDRFWSIKWHAGRHPEVAQKFGGAVFCGSFGVEAPDFMSAVAMGLRSIPSDTQLYEVSEIPRGE